MVTAVLVTMIFSLTWMQLTWMTALLILTN